MSDRASGKAGDAAAPLLTPLTVAILLAVGIASFLAMLVLGAYAPDLRGGGNGGGHALSNSVTGFSGLVRLAGATGRSPRIVRNTHLLNTEDLVVATPESGATPVDPVLGPRETTPTLLVLPKWATVPDAKHRGWASVFGLKDAYDPSGVLAPATPLAVIRRPSGGRALRTVEPLLKGVAFAAPRPLQAIRPMRPKAKSLYGALKPLVVDDAGNIVVGRFEKVPIFLVADPDLLDNRGMRDRRTAASALAMLDWMNSNQAQGIAFDVTMNGFGHGASPLKLLFEPPFLATTLTLATTILLAALASAVRFGSPRLRGRVIALGKTALVDNTAALVRKARREARLGGRYAEVVRDLAARALGVPARLRGDALDAYLDRLRPGERFTTLAGAVARAKREDELTRAARALHDWMGRRR